MLEIKRYSVIASMMLLLSSCQFFAPEKAGNDEVVEPRKPAYAAPVKPSDVITDPETGLEIASNQIVAIFNPEVKIEVVRTLIQQNGCSIIGEIPSLNWYQVSIPNGKTVGEMIQVFKQYPEAKEAFPNTITTENAISPPNDPYWPAKPSDAWHLAQINCLEAWELSKGNPKVNIAVVDDGVRAISDLVDKIDSGWNVFDQNDDCTPSEPFTFQCNDHGTGVAGVAAASTNNGIGIAGVSWLSRIVPFKVTSDSKKGTGFSLTTGISEAIDRAREKNIKVINVSQSVNFFHAWMTDIFGTSFAEVAEKASLNDVLIVAAAHDYQFDEQRLGAYPACLANNHDNVIAVAATNTADDFARGWGADITVGAPGCSIPTFAGDANGYYDYLVSLLDGTSFAAPIVSGVAALIWSLDLESDGDYDLKPSDIKRIIMDTGDPTDSGFKRVNAYKALQQAQHELGLSTSPSVVFRQFIPGIEMRPGYHSVMDVTLSPDGSKLYAAHWESGTVITTDPIGVYSTSNYALQQTIPVGRGVGGVAVSPDGRYVYGTAFYDGTLSRFDTWNSNAVTIIMLGSWAEQLWMNADGTKLIANYNAPETNPSTSHTLALVDISNGNFTVLNTLSMGRPVSHRPVAFSQTGTYMYVGCSSSMTQGPSLVKVSMMSFTVSGSCGLANGAGQQSDLAGVVRVGSTLYVGDGNNKRLYTVDEAGFTKTGEKSLPYAPSAIALHPDGKYLFVLYGYNGTLSVLSLPSLTIAATLSGLNPGLTDIEFSSDGKTAYLAQSDQTLGGFSVVDLTGF